MKLLLKLFKRKANKPDVNRRSFIKGLAVVPAIVALPSLSSATTVKETTAKKEVEPTHEEIAKKFDEDFTSPFLYVKANEDIKQGDKVVRDRKSKDPYSVRVMQTHFYPSDVPDKCFLNGSGHHLGIACVDAKKDDFFFIQCVGALPFDNNKRIFDLIDRNA